jgi:hypothetical protein
VKVQFAAMAALALLGAAACSQAAVRAVATPHPVASPAPTHGTPHHASGFPQLIRARLLGPPPKAGGAVLPRGTRITATDVGPRVRLSDGSIAGLANRGDLFGSVYPAVSTDAGDSWSVNGPPFSIAGASGPDATDHIAASPDGTVVAWGRGGNFVKTTTDGGSHWYQATFPAGVGSAEPKGGRTLRVRAVGEQRVGSKFATRLYVSFDGGRSWHRRQELAPVPY